jgi:hypothetical protein
MEQNGRESLRRLKPIVGCNASRRKRRGKRRSSYRIMAGRRLGRRLLVASRKKCVSVSKLMVYRTDSGSSEITVFVRNGVEPRHATWNYRQRVV